MSASVAPGLVAYGDESFLESDTGGFYVLACAVFAADSVEEARMVMSRMWGGAPASKLHWADLTSRQREKAAQEIAQLNGLHLVAAGAPVPRRKQERARAICLDRLVRELHGYEVTALYMEAREATLNRRDIATVIGARFALPKGARFEIQHHRGGTEPLLWAADIVAGAVRSHRQGESLYQSILADRIYDIHVDTGC